LVVARLLRCALRHRFDCAQYLAVDGRALLLGPSLELRRVAEIEPIEERTFDERASPLPLCRGDRRAKVFDVRADLVAVEPQRWRRLDHVGPEVALQAINRLCKVVTRPL